MSLCVFREMFADKRVSKDYELDRLLSTLGDDYTVLLFSDPNEFKAYEPSFVEPMRTDLKRRAEAEPVYVGRRAGNATDNRGLFERYQFFTPGMSPLTCPIVWTVVRVISY